MTSRKVFLKGGLLILFKVIGYTASIAGRKYIPILPDNVINRLIGMNIKLMIPSLKMKAFPWS